MESFREQTGFELASPYVQAKVRGILGEAYRQSYRDANGIPINAFGQDPGIASFGAALCTEAEDPTMIATLCDLYSDRFLIKGEEPLNPAVDFNFLQKAVQNVLRRFSPDFPTPYLDDSKNVDQWRRDMARIFKQPAYFETLHTLVMHFGVYTNNAQRYSAPKAFLLNLEAALGEPIRVVDVGASQNHGLKKLTLPDPSTYPFEPIHVVSSEAENALVDVDLTERMNRLIGKPLGIKFALGIDVWPGAFARATKALAEDQFLRPKEFTHANLARYQDFDDLVVRGVDYVELDLLEPQNRDNVPRILDAALFVTMLNQLLEPDQAEIIEAASENMRPGPDKFAVVVDFIKKSNRTELGLESESRWDPWTYRTFVIDLNRPEEGPKHLFSMETGRARKMVVQDEDNFVLGGKRLYPADLLKLD